ncbi:hypothetical protein [Catellatospora sichuanensis]|uniref:hypothetical protein n=1 Tax=Catellatospora sichuanensis TaxID=1969805 RepID=UPI001181F085|nr:hypothetical protein [Catellatospora sichuanensis]
METLDINLDPDDLTLGDLEDFEEFVGKPIDDVVRPVPVLDDEGNRVFDAKGRPEMTTKIPAKGIICLVWLVKRKSDPSFTLADARKVRVTALVLGKSPEADSGKS